MWKDFWALCIILNKCHANKISVTCIFDPAIFDSTGNLFGEFQSIVGIEASEAMVEQVKWILSSTLDKSIKTLNTSYTKYLDAQSEIGVGRSDWFCFAPKNQNINMRVTKLFYLFSRRERILCTALWGFSTEGRKSYIEKKDMLKATSNILQ